MVEIGTIVSGDNARYKLMELLRVLKVVNIEIHIHLISNGYVVQSDWKKQMVINGIYD